MIDFEGIELADTEAVDAVAYPLDELGQASLVILRNDLDRARRSDLLGMQRGD